MLLPTDKELATLYMDVFDLVVNTPTPKLLCEMTEEETDIQIDVSREAAVRAIRNAILDVLIAHFDTFYQSDPLEWWSPASIVQELRRMKEGVTDAAVPS